MVGCFVYGRCGGEEDVGVETFDAANADAGTGADAGFVGEFECGYESCEAEGCCAGSGAGADDGAG